MSLDKLNPALLRTDGASDGDALVFSAANARLEFKTAISASDFAANDYSTYTTLQSEYSANDYNTLLSAQSNDFITYTTLLGRLDIVQDNVAAAAGGGDALGVVSNNTLDLSTGNFFEVTADDQTLTFSNPPAAHAFSIKVTGAGTVSGFDLSIASYAQSFSVLGQDPFAHDLFFKSDGAKMYVLGAIGDDVNEYDLSTAWDISTASYLQNFSVVAQGNTPTGLFFHPDGIKMYVICQSSDSIHEYNLSTAWDISTATFAQSFSVSAQDTIPQGLFFRPDGLKVYIVGREADKANEYNLSTAWDISTAAFVQFFSVTAQNTEPAGIYFREDGAKMFVVGYGSPSVHEYNLSTAWDISTATFVQSFSVVAQDTTPTGLFFQPGGIKMYVSGPDSDAIHEYTTGSVTAATITYPASVTFESGSPPAAPAVGAVETIDLYTVNGGTNYYDAGYSSQPTKPVFQAWARNIVLNTTYTEVTSWEDVFVNIGNHFDTTTGRFTAPVDGTYQFGVASITNNAATVFRFRPYLDGVSLNNYELRIQPTTGVYFPNTEFCWYATMTSGQVMSVYALSSDGTDTYDGGIDFRYHYFRGQLVT
jgi:hypothetical protein